MSGSSSDTSTRAISLRVVIHAGLNKTGSSTLQEYFFSMRASFAEQRVIYPDFGHRSHWSLAAAFGKDGTGRYLDRRVKNERGELSSDEAKAHLQRLLGSMRDGDILLLSHETFISSKLRRLLRFIDAQTSSMKVDVIAYVRDPFSHLVSAVGHRLKGLEQDRGIRPDTWVSDHPAGARKLRELAGRDRLTLRAFSPATLIDRDIVADFRETFACVTGRVLPPPPQAIRANTALSAASCGLLQIVQTAPKELLSVTSYRYIRTKLQELDAADGSGGKLQLPATWRHLVANNNRTNWNRLVRGMGYDEACREKLYLEKKLLQAEKVDPTQPVFADSAEWALSYFDPLRLKRLVSTLQGSETQRRLKKEAAGLTEWLENRSKDFSAADKDAAPSDDKGAVPGHTLTQSKHRATAS